MQAVRQMSTKGISAKCRAFMLWFIATVLIVMAMAISPAYAFAASADGVQRGTLTLDEPAKAAPASNPAPAAAPAPAADPTPAAAPAPAATPEPVQASSPEPTTSASSTPAADPGPTSTADTPPQPAESAAPPVETATNTAPASTPAENQSAGVVDSSDEIAASTNNETTTPETSKPDTTQAKDEANGVDDNSNASNEVDKSNTSNASNPDTTKPETSTSSGQINSTTSNNGSNEVASTTAQPNAPPANLDASNSESEPLQCVANDATSSNYSVVAISNSSNSSSYIATNNISYNHIDEGIADSNPLQNDANVLATQDITTQAYTIYFQFWYDPSSTDYSQVQIKSGMSNPYVGPSNDYIYDANGNYLCLASDLYPVEYTSTYYLPSFKRHGTEINDCFVPTIAGRYSNSMKIGGTVNNRMNGAIFLVTWKPPEVLSLDFRDLAGHSGASDGFITRPGLSLVDTVDLPSDQETADMSGYNPATFAGWYLQDDVEERSGQYFVKATSQAIQGTETLWDIVSRVYSEDVAPGKPYKRLKPITAGKYFVVAALSDQTTPSVEYVVKYHNTNASGSDVSSSIQQFTHDAATNNTAKTILSLGFDAPTEDGYDFTFGGWSTSAGGAAVITSDGGALAALNPSTGQTYNIYAVWTKTPQTYTVVYNPNGFSGKNAITEANHKIAELSTDKAKSATSTDLWGIRDGYTFVGWSSTATGSAYLNANAAFSNASDTAGNTPPKKGSTVQLYAIWQSTQYTVNFNAGASSGVTGTISNPYSFAVDTATLTGAPTLARQGYTFEGWKEGNTLVTDKNNIVTNTFKTAATAGSTHTLTASWSEVTYTINWYPKWAGKNHITMGTSTVEYESEANTKLSSKVPSKDSNNQDLLPADLRATSGSNTYEFIGWYVTKSGSQWATPGTGVTALGNMTISEALAVTGADKTDNSITIYGIWKQLGAATVTYFYNYKNGTSGTYRTDNAFAGDTYTVYAGVPTDTGYTFVNWNTLAKPSGSSQGTTYVGGDQINNVQTTKLYAQWRENTAKVTLKENATDSSIVLNKKSNITTLTGGVIQESMLTTATPTRTGYEFKGWARSASGPVVVGPTDSDAKYTVLASEVPADNSEITLYAIWQELTYTVRYHANAGTDTTNAVTFTKNTGGATTASPYIWTEKTKRTDTGLGNPDITATRNWYNWVAWGTSANATTGILNTDQLGTLYDAQGGTGRVLDLYAIWEAKTLEVIYEAADSSKGSVTPVTETINLATGLNASNSSAIQGSTATVSASGYTLATPTWKLSNGTVATGVSTTTAQAKYTPTITYLRNLYNAVPSTQQVTFQAHFVEAEYKFQVQAFMQKANGTWNNVWTSGNDLSFTNPGGTSLTAKFGNTVKHTDTITSSQPAYNNKALWELALVANTDGVLNEYLFELDTANSNNIMNFVVAAENGPTFSNNILKLYYKRATYKLNVEFQTEDENGAKTSNAPDSVTRTPESYVNNSNATTSLRWGESVPVQTPSATGYTFSWSITTPNNATSTTPGTAFTLNAADMGTVAQSANKTAVLTGTFKVVTYSITLKDGANSTRNWTTGDSASTMKTNGLVTKQNVAANKTLGNWVPTPTDKPEYTYYLAGWKDDADNTGTIIATDTLRSMTNWSSNKSFTAVWLEKIVIAYDRGVTDSNGQSKAAWTSKSISLTNLTDASEVLLATTAAKFVTLLGSGNVDGNGSPKGAAGWIFDYWTIDGDTNNFRYGHASAYQGTGANPTGVFLDGETRNPLNGIKLGSSYKFIAHWKGVEQNVTINGAGPVGNNASQYGPGETITAVLPNVAGPYYTDDVLDLSNYNPVTIPAGYTLAGWEGTFQDAVTGTTTNVSYAPNAKFNVQNGTTTLNPVFNENTVTFNYQLDDGSAGKGSISPNASDTVYAVKHNGIYDHVAQSNNSTAYSFVNWTYNNSELTDSPTIQASHMNIPATEVLTADRTYYANFKTNTFTLSFNAAGTDGTKAMGSVAATGTGAGNNNDFAVEWNSTIPSGGVVTVQVPEGYELDGWLVDDATTPQVFTGGNAQNNQGIGNYLVTGDHTLTAHFRVSTSKNYTVNYSYDPQNISKFASIGENSRAVAWGEDVYPSNVSNRTPAQSGYTFDGWFVDAAYTQTVDSVGPDFGSIYQEVNGTNREITIYAKWTARQFKVAYDVYGNVEDDPNTPNDDVIGASAVTSRTNVGWNDLASTFKTPTTPISRPGYSLSGWTATITKTEGGTKQTSSNVLDSNTYGMLADNTDANETITLRAIWTSVNYLVQYEYNDSHADFAEGPTSVKVVSKGWADPVDFYTLGAAPTHVGFKFNGWDVQYVGKVGEQGNGQPILETIHGTRLTKPENLTIRDIRNGDIASLSDPVIRFIASWTKESSYVFKDILVHADGTYHEEYSTSPITVDGNTVVNFSQYGTPKTSYEGYDFDEHIASNPNFAGKTETSMVIIEGTNAEYFVYYLERSYKIDFFTNETDASGSFITNNNAWNSAPAKLPTTTPSKSGYTFDGWYITDGTNEAKIDGTNTLSTLTSVFATAPQNGATLKAVGKWTQNQAVIAWNTVDESGTTNPAAGFATRGAADDTAIAPITAVPASTDYVFDKWTYAYTDANGVAQSGTVGATSAFATLSGNDGETLTPVKWAMNTGDEPVWHDITFTAHFVLSTALKAVVEYYLEDGSNLGTYGINGNPNDSETKYDAVDDSVYTVSDPKTFAGYKLNESKSDLSHAYDYDTPSTWVFKVYLDALAHNVEYKYVEADGTTVQAAPTGAPALATFGSGVYYTGQTLTVDAAPTFAGWQFKGWFLSTNYGVTNVSGTSIEVGSEDIQLVGTWERIQRHVNFINDPSSEFSALSVSQANGGYTVADGSKVNTALGSVAATLADLGVTYNANGQPYTLTGWKVLIGGVAQGDAIGISDPLNYDVLSDVTFQAVWSETYRVTYTRGLHGAFTDSDGTKTYVESPKLTQGSQMFEYNGSTQNGKPNAVDGWEFVGWGAKTNGEWTYYFVDEAGIDYGSTTGSHALPSALPATVTSNIEYVGFYKALDRTLVFSSHAYDSNVAVGQESAAQFDPEASFAGGTTTSYTVKTGANATMLGANAINRTGYVLVGWTDGTKTYTQGSNNEFVMPEVADGTTVYLYPVFSFDQLEINYAVASDSTGWGSVDRASDTKSKPTDRVVGSQPIDSAGYQFGYWTKDAGTTALTQEDGLQADNKTLIPTASGTYYAHFIEKEYDFAMAQDPAITGVTLPETPLPSNKHWTDSITLETPTRAGYTFAGWDVYATSDWEEDHTSAPKLYTGVPAGPTLVSDLSSGDGMVDALTLVPTWTAISYEVLFDDGVTSGTGLVSDMPLDYLDVEFNANDIDASAPSREGYEFAGWVNSVTGATIPASAALVYSDLANNNENNTSVTLTATWTALPHTITYKANEGDVWSSDTAKYPTGDPINAGTSTNPSAAINTATDAVINLRSADTISHSGSVLIGWKHGDTEYLFLAGTTFSMPNADVELTPIWQEAGDYNVRFDAGAESGVVGMPSDRLNITYTTSNIDTSAPQRAGYTFLGWTNSAPGGATTAGTGIAYAALVNDDDSIKTVTLTATWSENDNYIVNFDKNAGYDEVTQMPSPNPQVSLTWGSTVATKHSSGDPKRNGYVFAGWTITDKNGVVLGGTDVTTFNNASALFSALAQNMDIADNAELTLKANWNPKTYEVEFVQNKPAAAAGTVSGMPAVNPIENLNYSDGNISLPQLTLDGYAFGGWTNSVTGSVIAAGTYDYATLANNNDENLKVTLNAVWTPNAHTVTYTIGAGETWSSNSADYPEGDPAATNAADAPNAIDAATDKVIGLRGENSVTKPGSKLLGWTDGTNDYLFENGVTTITVPDNNLTLSPIWEELGNYSVNYLTGDSDGATPVDAQTMPSNLSGITYAKNDISTAHPTRPGYTFDGWSNDVGNDVAAGTLSIDYATLVGNDPTKTTVNLTAKWIANEIYKVTYKDGVPEGSIAFTGQLPQNRTNIGFDANDIKQTELNTDGTERIGFTFAGWRVTNDADNSVIATITGGYAVDAVYSALVGGQADITAITFTAMWEGTPYDLTYHLEDGTWINDNITDAGAATPNAAITYNVEHNVTLRGANTVRRDGYELIGWANGTDNTAVGYKEYKFATVGGFSMPAADVDLYPLWVAKEYHVTFVDKPANDTGTIQVTNMPLPAASYTYNADVAYAAPSRIGYEFTGWDVYKTSEYDADASTAIALRHVGAGNSAYAALAADPDIASLTLVASWRAENFIVLYRLNDGEGTWVSANINDAGRLNPKGEVGYVTDSTVNLRLADTVSRNGYELIGWKDSNEPNVTPVEYLFSNVTSFTMPADNVYLYPIWNTKTGYTVTFDGNAPTTNVAPGAVLLDVPDNQPVAGAVLTWSGNTGLVVAGPPTFTGYTFKGWVVYGSDGVVVGGTDVSPIAGGSHYFNVLAANVDSEAHKNLTLKAKWEIAQIYSVIFKDGVNDEESPVTAGSMPEDAIDISYITMVDYAAPNRLGYTFDGWSVVDATDPRSPNPMGGIQAGSNYYYELVGNNAAIKKLELTAKWIAKKIYNIHFVDKNDTNPTPVNMGALTDLYGLGWDELFDAAPIPTREGYDFRKLDGVEKWAVTNTSDPNNVKSIGAATIGSYTFADLAYNAAAGVKDDTITDITFTAIWIPHEHTVTYVLTAGEGSWIKTNIMDAGKAAPDAPVIYKVDDAVELRNASTLMRAGYVLAGWQDDADVPNVYYVDAQAAAEAGVDVTNGFTMRDVDVQLFPIWRAKVYKVVFNDNIGSVVITDSALQTVGNMPPNPQENLNWTSPVDTKNPTLAGYKFAGWTIDGASTTGALTGNLFNATYAFDELAITDIAEHETLTLTAQWTPATYRVTYIDRFDANGAATDAWTVIATDATKLWGDTVSNKDPWKVGPTRYAGKSDDDWHFDGWSILDVASGNYMMLGPSDSLVYSVLAAHEDLTVAEVATDADDPALVLFANWTRYVPFIVEYTTRPDGLVEGSETRVGLDGEDIESVWKSIVLGMGDTHNIPGYQYNKADSAPGITGTLTAGTTLRLTLYYDQLNDYVIIYDATPGALKTDATVHTDNLGGLSWNAAATSFVPVNDDWAYTGHKIDHWAYGPTGKEYTFAPSGNLTYGDIVKAIYGDNADGSQGRDLNGDGTIDIPVTLYAVWTERTDYKVKYDDNYVADDGKNNSGITNGKFLERTDGATYTPGAKEDVAWSSTDILPTGENDIVQPGVKDGIALYEIDGWNYLSKDGTQKPADNRSFEDIVKDMYLEDTEPENNEITLYARWKEIQIELKYTPTLVTVNENGEFVAATGNGGGTLSRTSELVSAVTGGNVVDAKLYALGSTVVTANPGYTFIGWRRVSNGDIVYIEGVDPSKLAVLLTQAAAGGLNVLPEDGSVATNALFAVMQNQDDGFWHAEEYQALFAQNAIAILHYDKNAEDAVGTIADVEEPFGTFITLSDGTPFTRQYWTLLSWNTKADGTGDTYELGKSGYEMPEGETTLYAQWQRNKATLAYDPNGEDVTGLPESITEEWGTQLKVTDSTPKRDHYTFKGWNTKADGTGEWYQAGDILDLPGAGETLYAQWEKEIVGVIIRETSSEGGSSRAYATSIEYGSYLPKGYVTATPNSGYHLKTWKYWVYDNDGNLIDEGTVDDPSTLQILGSVEFEPVFEKDAGNNDNNPIVNPVNPDNGDNGSTEPAKDSASKAKPTPTSSAASGKELPKTGDALMPLLAGFALLALLAAGILALLFVRRRRNNQ